MMFKKENSERGENKTVKFYLTMEAQVFECTKSLIKVFVEKYHRYSQFFFFFYICISFISIPIA